MELLIYTSSDTT